MKVTIDESCTGCGLCVEACPDVFELGDDGLATVKLEEIPANLADEVKDAAGQCPVEAIQVTE